MKQRDKNLLQNAASEHCCFCAAFSCQGIWDCAYSPNQALQSILIKAIILLNQCLNKAHILLLNLLGGGGGIGRATTHKICIWFEGLHCSYIWFIMIFKSLNSGDPASDHSCATDVIIRPWESHLTPSSLLHRWNRKSNSHPLSLRQEEKKFSNYLYRQVQSCWGTKVERERNSSYTLLPY